MRLATVKISVYTENTVEMVMARVIRGKKGQELFRITAAAGEIALVCRRAREEAARRGYDTSLVEARQRHPRLFARSP